MANIGNRPASTSPGNPSQMPPGSSPQTGSGGQVNHKQGQSAEQDKQFQQQQSTEQQKPAAPQEQQAGKFPNPGPMNPVAEAQGGTPPVNPQQQQQTGQFGQQGQAQQNPQKEEQSGQRLHPDKTSPDTDNDKTSPENPGQSRESTAL